METKERTSGLRTSDDIIAECPLCNAFAVVALPADLLAVQPDDTTHVCHPGFGGCNHGFAVDGEGRDVVIVHCLGCGRPNLPQSMPGVFCYDCDDDPKMEAYWKTLLATMRDGEDMIFTWILDDDGNPIPCDDSKAFEAFLRDTERRRIGYDEIGEVTISTVFLGVDHRHFLGGTPILFETMIFGGPHDLYCERYTNRQDALQGHRRAVEMVTSRWNDV